MAHVNRIVVGYIKQTFFEEACRSVRNHAVALHLTESEPTVTRSALCWLPCEDLRWPSTSGVDFVCHHMLQTLIESGTKENHNLQALAGESRVHHLVAVTLITQFVQHARYVLDCLAAERSSITLVSV